MELDHHSNENKTETNLVYLNKYTLNRDHFSYLYPNVMCLFDEVTHKVDKYWCNGIEFLDNESFPDTTFGQTRGDKLSVEIKLKTPIDRDKLEYVLVHELGEADYLAEGFPEAYNDDSADGINEITMLFSHLHARKLAREHGLSDTPPRECPAGKDYPYLSRYSPKWRLVLHLAWIIISYPQCQGVKDQLEGYAANAAIIDQIVGEAEQCSFTPDDVQETMGRIINFLVGQGMQPQVEVKIPRDEAKPYLAGCKKAEKLNG